MAAPVYLSYSAFRQRTIMPPADVSALAELRWRRQQGDAAAADPTPETTFGVAPAPGGIVWVTFTPQDAVVADAANYATINVYKRTAGEPRTLIASASTTPSGTGNLAAGVAVAIALQSGATLDVDDVVTAEIVKVGTGVVIPAGMLALLPAVTFFDIRIAARTSWINARLAKRYAVPFDQAAPPDIVLDWLTRLITADAYARRGFNPTSSQDADAIIAARDRALDEIKEAADSKDGLFELPLRDDDASSSAIAKAGPLGYSEASPYTWADLQAQDGRTEDSSGR